MTERHGIVTKQSQTGEPKRGTVNREGGGSIRPTLGGGCGVSPGMARCGTAFEAWAR
jgi:hypothetical protein